MAFEGWDSMDVDGYLGNEDSFQTRMDNDIHAIADAIEHSGCLEDIWRKFSEETYCAGFMSPYSYVNGEVILDSDTIEQFEKWIESKIK